MLTYIRLFFGLSICTMALLAPNATFADSSTIQRIVDQLRIDLGRETLEQPSNTLPKNIQDAQEHKDLNKLVKEAISKVRSNRKLHSVKTSAAPAVTHTRYVGSGTTSRSARPNPLVCAFDGRQFIGHLSLLRHLQQTSTGKKRKTRINLNLTIPKKASIEPITKPISLSGTEAKAAKLLVGDIENEENTDESDLPIQ